MDTFFRHEMLVASSEFSIPAHQKTSRLIAALGDHPSLNLIDNFLPIEVDDWLGVHSREYVNAVHQVDVGTFQSATIPPSKEMKVAIQYCAGSIVAAAVSAIESGCAFSPTSGFHHARWDAAGVLCLLNALPLAASRALEQLGPGRVLILDCDFHRGNGTEDILARMNESRIAHKSLGYRFNNKSQDVDYMNEIERTCGKILNSNYALVIYQAGMDVLLGDPSGGGILTLEQTRERDEMVFSACRNSEVSIVWNLAGGYIEPTTSADVIVEGHLNTFNAAVKAFS